jgi:copper oxidase (laccase) domain-containing protein
VPAPDSFQPLGHLRGVRAAFIPRIEGIDVATDRETALQRLAPAHSDALHAAGFDPGSLATAEQVHGAKAAVVAAPGKTVGVDALITAAKGLTLGIYVADCAAVYIADRKDRAIALIHSGRAGTEADITGNTIRLMSDEFGVDPTDLAVHISPCIRPPLYETDFAATIAQQAHEAGAGQVADAGICTGRNVARYYSYRVERGQTGRMLAVLALAP